METTLNMVIAILIILAGFVTYQTFAGILNLIRLKGTPQYQRWRKRSGKLKLIDSIERAIAIFLIITTVVIITLILLWGKNQ